MPSPREILHTARKWCSPQLSRGCSIKKLRETEYIAHIQKRTSGTKAETTNPKSIIESVYKKVMNTRVFSLRHGQGNDYSLVARANQRFCAFFAIPSSSVCSEAATEPHGYSAPTPIPRRSLNKLEQRLTINVWKRTYRMMLSMTTVPRRLSWAPSEAADKPENRKTIPVAAI